MKLRGSGSVLCGLLPSVGGQSFCSEKCMLVDSVISLPKCMASSKTFKTEGVRYSPEELVFKPQQEYKAKLARLPKLVNGLLNLVFDMEGEVNYHEDM